MIFSRKRTPPSLSYLYKCLILPHLDYCSAVWEPSTITLINKLESVQKFAAKLVTLEYTFWLSPSLPELVYFTSQEETESYDL